MKTSKLALFPLILSVFIIMVACSSDKSSSNLSDTDSTEMNHDEMNHGEMNHDEMDHDEMDHDEMDHDEKPVPKTAHMLEVTQQEVNNELSKWHKQGIKGKGIKIAVLDTGLDLNSNDISYKEGKNFVGDSLDFADNQGHGTKISGIIGALENEHNLLGVAPLSNLYIGKVADEHGNVKVENLVKGIEWAISKDVDIINISLEFPKKHSTLEKAIKKAHKKNIIVISSSGNTKFVGDTSLAYPGAYKEVINVGMLDTEGKIYSNEYKKKKVDVYAPGEDLFSSYFNDKMTLDTGVSFAVAYTSGYTALLIERYKAEGIDYDMKKVTKDLKQNLESNL